MARYPTDGTGAVTPIPLQPGQSIRLDRDPWWWTVRAVTDHFTALTRQVRFKPAGTRCYTVIDWRNGVRGPCNLIGQGYGDGTYTEAECAEMLAQFEAGDLEVSQRNWLPARVVNLIPNGSPA